MRSRSSSKISFEVITERCTRKVWRSGSSTIRLSISIGNSARAGYERASMRLAPLPNQDKNDDMALSKSSASGAMIASERTMEAQLAPVDAAKIAGYHAHIYYDERTRADAAWLRE